MEKLLFVCLGNICRSPMAEFVMKDLVSKAGRSDNFYIESRGTLENGHRIHSATRRELTVHGVLFDENKRSQRISVADFENFDEIIAMDTSNLKNLLQLSPDECKPKIRLLLDKSVADPWYTGDFESTYKLIKFGCEKLLENL